MTKPAQARGVTPRIMPSGRWPRRHRRRVWGPGASDKRWLVTLAGFVLTLATLACANASPPQRPALSIAAASDLRYALDELVTEYRHAHPETGVSVSYGSSGNLYAQIANGGPFDLYLSADIEYPRRLVADKHAVADSLFQYANGRIALWVPASSPLDLDARGIVVLGDLAVRQVAIANPEHAPYGRAAMAALASANLTDVVRPKLVLGENVSQALQFVQSGSADVGIVALSLVRAPAMLKAGRHAVIPAELHPPLEQGGVISAHAARPDAAAEFTALMTGPQGRALLERYGFEVPNRSLVGRTGGTGRTARTGGARQGQPRPSA